MPAVPVILEMLKIHTTRHVVVRAGVDALQQLAICPENKDKLTHCVALLLVAMKGVCPTEVAHSLSKAHALCPVFAGMKSLFRVWRGLEGLP